MTRDFRVIAQNPHRFAFISWGLEDGEIRHRQHPNTFEIPPLEERESLGPGDAAQLAFRLVFRDATRDETCDAGERMWVIVIGLTARGYRGTLANTPYCTDQLVRGAVVTFEPRHVINIDEAGHEGRAS
jgi:hypothetical protein